MKTSSVKALLVLLVLCFGACTTRTTKVPTMDSYLEVEEGDTREDVLRKFGSPVSITVEGDGTEIYKYIERFSLNGEVIESRTYLFYIKDGKVVGKIANTVHRPQVIDSDKTTNSG